jgi:hypothetical protein
MALTLVDLTNTVTGTLPAANGGTGATSFPAPGANGNALISNGTTWTSTAISTKPFVTGTSMLFRQTAAPTGWTKVTSFDNYALRIVSGSASTGGSVAFTTAFASQTPSYTPSNGTLSATAGTLSVSSISGTVGATTLSTAQIPSHSHTYPTYTTPDFNNGSYAAGNSSSGATPSTNNAGSGGSHTHSFSGSGSIGGSPSLSGTVGGSVSAINLAVQYVDVIIANID